MGVVIFALAKVPGLRGPDTLEPPPPKTPGRKKP